MGLAKRKIDRYLELVRQFPLKPLHTDGDLKRAQAMLNTLLDIEELNQDQQDYLHVLGTLIHEYEAQHHPIESVPPAQLLAFLIESKGVSHKTVARAVGMTEAGISHLLPGRRRFGRDHIERLSKYFNISPAAFFPR
jgi:HTH-type transcriptional regulator / antitoxin HigA